MAGGVGVGHNVVGIVVWALVSVPGCGVGGQPSVHSLSRGLLAPCKQVGGGWAAGNVDPEGLGIRGLDAGVARVLNL